jgi:hypothetical protein
MFALQVDEEQNSSLGSYQQVGASSDTMSYYEAMLFYGGSDWRAIPLLVGSGSSGISSSLNVFLNERLME